MGKNSTVGTSVNKISSLYHFKAKSLLDYQTILYKLPLPVSLWELDGNDYSLIYLNKSAEEIIKPKLSIGVKLRDAFPSLHLKQDSFPTEDKKGLTSKIFIDEDYLMIFDYASDKDILIQKPAKNWNESFRKIIEQSPISIIVTNTNGNIIYVNPKLVETSGYTAEELKGKNPKILKSGNKSSAEYGKLWDTILSGKVWKGEFTNRRKNGELYYECAVISPIEDSNGKISNFIAFKEDVSNLKKAHEELKKSEKLTALGKVAAYITHEIKTPLTSIKINIDLLEKDEAMNPNSKKILSEIRKEIKRLTTLSKNILEYSNHINLLFSNINLHKQIENIKEFLEPLFLEKKIIFYNRTSGHNILGDAQQLRSLFIHLIENSIESIKSNGVIEISSELKGDLCYIYVKDSGAGLECTENIFEPYITTKSTSSGLGLAIAKNIVDKHNGTIELLSSKRGETVFEITLKTREEKIGQIINY